MIRRKIHNLLHPKTGEVWMLHRVVEQRSDVPEQRDLEVTAEWLERRISDYRARGYRFVPVDQLTSRGRWVCVTLDDGYRDNLTVALPLFRRLQVPFCVYVATGFLDNRREMWWYPGQPLALGTDELRRLATEPLCTIGAHTVSHSRLDTLARADQQREIVQSKQELETLLNRKVNHFSYPHGAYNADTVAICREAGFHTAVRSWGGSFRRGDSLLAINRVNITQE